MESIFHNKIYLITTNWTYPFGGGEEFMYDTMQWASELGMKSYWIAFSNSKNVNFTEFKIIKHKYGTIIDIPDGMCVDTLSKWLYIIRPDIIHHQGNLRDKFFMATEELRIEFLTGFHFWTGGLILDDSKKNINIIENAQYHRTDPEFEFLIKKDKCNFYCASQFVQEAIEKITGHYIPDIIFPSSSIERYFIKDNNPWNSKYVVMINIHKHKGGELFYHLLKKCPDIHFLCVRTEHDSDDLDELIKKEIEDRNNTDHADCVFMERTSDVKFIYKLTKILLCITLVDETFCRVVNEAMMNGIPTLTTHRGNVKYLIGDTTPKLDPDDPDEWMRYLREIYFDRERYNIISEKMREQYELSSEEYAKNQFKDVIGKIIRKSSNMNIGIFTPWCDQGLGIQSRNYYNMLKDTFNMSIFALKPYNADSCIALQKEPSEWIVSNIYYSKNTRENVNDNEIIEFCKKYNIGKMIIPETCWPRIFQIAKLLREINVKAYAIPNIEIVRRDEIYKHNYFYKILANNYLCKKYFDVLDIPCNYIGYGVNADFIEKEYSDNLIKFLFIGGMNAFSRKNVLDVCEAFTIAYGQNNNLRLTVTVQMTNTLEEIIKNKIKQYKTHPAIDIIEKHISYKDIINLYHTHHVSIQVSKHEGLGLGFYEGITTGTPVLTLNTPPHNEIILDNVNGWTIECYYKPMTDNKDPLFDSAYFLPKTLSEKILEISNKDTISSVIESLKQDYQERLSYDKFKNRFINELL